MGRKRIKMIIQAIIDTKRKPAIADYCFVAAINNVDLCMNLYINVFTPE